MPMPITVNEDPDLIPRCPHCGAELSEMSSTPLQPQGSFTFRIGKRHVYVCPFCRKILGFSQRGS